MRYFRLTHYFKVTTNSFSADWKIDIEPSRKTESDDIKNLQEIAVSLVQTISKFANDSELSFTNIEQKIIETKYTKFSDKINYCLFISPKIHIDTLYHFWTSIKHGYNGGQQQIIPLTTEQFASFLETLLILIQKDKRFSHTEVEKLYKEIILKTNHIYNGNCISILKNEIKQGSIPLIFADPPYNLSGNSLNLASNTTGGAFYKVNVEWDIFNYKEYLDFTKKWIAAYISVLLPNGSLYVSCTHHNIAEIIFTAKKLGLKLNRN